MDYLRNYNRGYLAISYIALKITQILGNSILEQKLLKELSNKINIAKLKNKEQKLKGADFIIKNSLYFKLGELMALNFTKNLVILRLYFRYHWYL